MALARERNRPAEYVEQHHEEPRSVGGSSQAINLVWLTAREHLVAHKLWARMELDPTRRRKAQNALWAMTVMRGRDNAGRIIPSSREYAAAKAAMIQSRVGIERSQECKDKIAASLKSHFAENGCHNKGRSFAHLTDEERSRIFGSGNRGRIQPSEERERRAAKLRKPRSEAAKINIRLGALKREAAKKQQRKEQHGIA